MHTKLFAVVAVGLMLFAAGPGLATADETATGNLAVSVSQHDDGSATVTVTQNETAAPNASVVVEAQNASYIGEDEYVTDENGTVGLPAPEENVTIDVTATLANESVSTTATLTVVNETADEEAFGQKVAQFVHALRGTSVSGPFGAHVASYVVANNPGNTPNHAGPPGFLTDNDTERGPPMAGDNETVENETEDEERAGGHGPPFADDEDDQRGPPDHADEDEEDEETADEEDDERGPPAHAGPPW